MKNQFFVCIAFYLSLFFFSFGCSKLNSPIDSNSVAVQAVNPLEIYPNPDLPAQYESAETVSNFSTSGLSLSTLQFWGYVNNIESCKDISTALLYQEKHIVMGSNPVTCIHLGK